MDDLRSLLVSFSIHPSTSFVEMRVAGVSLTRGMLFSRLWLSFILSARLRTNGSRGWTFSLPSARGSAFPIFPVFVDFVDDVDGSTVPDIPSMTGGGDSDDGGRYLTVVVCLCASVMVRLRGWVRACRTIRARRRRCRAGSVLRCSRCAHIWGNRARERINLEGAPNLNEQLPE